MPWDEKLEKDLENKKPEALKHLEELLKDISNLKGTMPYEFFQNIYKKYKI